MNIQFSFSFITEAVPATFGYIVTCPTVHTHFGFHRFNLCFYHYHLGLCRFALSCSWAVYATSVLQTCGCDIPQLAIRCNILAPAFSITLLAVTEAHLSTYMMIIPGDVLFDTMDLRGMSTLDSNLTTVQHVRSWTENDVLEDDIDSTPKRLSCLSKEH